MNDSTSGSSVDDSSPALLIAQIHQLLDELAAQGLGSCSDAELVEMSAENERASNRLQALGNRQVVEISNRNIPRALGFRNLTALMDVRLRMSDVARRKRAIEATAEFTALTGEQLPPRCPTLAQVCETGQVGAKHLDTVLGVIDDIPAQVAHDVKVAAERQMAEFAPLHTPRELAQLGARLLAQLDPDGSLADDSDRARKRNLWLSRSQNPTGMSVIKGRMDPMGRARMKTFLEAWAAPGMNNPDDEKSPRGAESEADSQALADAVKRDDRTAAQRNHDALVALLAAVQDDGLLGKSNRGVPIQVIVKARYSELAAAAGVATTMTDDLIPIPTLVNSAAKTQMWLAVFADAGEVPLYFGRAKRLATMEQRLASSARTGGQACSFPDCDQPAARCQMRHAVADFAKDGLTDITDLAPACGRHNRMVGDGPGKFTTGVVAEGPDRGRCWWQRNSSAGMPENPKLINRMPDVGVELSHTLGQVRAEIHRPAEPEQTEREPERPAEDSADPPDTPQMMKAPPDPHDSTDWAQISQALLAHRQWQTRQADMPTATRIDIVDIIMPANPPRGETITVFHRPGASHIEACLEAQLVRSTVAG